MKIVLVNANPAVSRLATLALSKMGYEYVQIEGIGELDGIFDVAILDSDIDVKETNLKDFADKILYLSSKNSPTCEIADRILPKPFLPTEFITIVEDLASKAKGDEASGEVSVKGFEFMDDLAEGVLKEEMASPDADEFALDDELGEILQESAPQSKESAFDELNEIVKAIDDMDEPSRKLEDDELDLDDLIGEAVKFDEPDEFEIAAKEEKFDGIEDAADTGEVGEAAEKFDIVSELDDVKFETTDEPEDAEDKFELGFDGSIEDIKHQIDEIDSMDEKNKDKSASFDEIQDALGAEEADDELDGVKFETSDALGASGFMIEESEDEPEVAQGAQQPQENDKFEIEENGEDIFADDEMKFDEPKEQAAQDVVLGDEDFLLDDIETAPEAEKESPADDANLAQDIFDDGDAEDIFAIDEQDEAQSNTKHNAQESIEPEISQNEPKTAEEFDASEYGDIEQISEKDMALALNESGYEASEAVNLAPKAQNKNAKIDELKAQISDAVAKNLETSLQDGELREALKNLNIKINISFEEK